MTGIILINKPVDVSSFHVVLRVKNVVGIKREKVGHAGTLDPFATGLMIVGIGREATRLLTQLTHSDKTYVATGKLGQATDTLDFTGKVIAESPWEHLTPDMLSAQCAQLIGLYEQIPPIYSALQYQGQRLYNMARKEYVPTSVLHEIVEQKKRMVRIRDLDLVSTTLPEFVVKAHVSHGTYIRVLVDEIARKLGSCAVTTALDRTAIGPFKSVYALDLEDLTSPEILQAHLMSVEQVSDLLAD
jgi:tRNA pseudouridine55 synthase